MSCSIVLHVSSPLVPVPATGKSHQPRDQLALVEKRCAKARRRATVLGKAEGMNDLISMLENRYMTLPQRADRIRSLVNVVRGCIIEVGRELIEAKAEVPHGQWLPWLEREFGWTEDTAQNYMRVAKAFEIPNGSVFGALTIDATALYALSAPDVPQSAREAAIEQAEAGERITKAAAEKLVAQAEKDMARKIREALAEECRASKARETEAIQKAKDKHAKDTAALQAAIAKIKAERKEPSIADAVVLFCKILGKSKLNAKQMQLLAQIVGEPVTDGKRVYPPVSEAELQRVEENLKIASAFDRALEYFPSAPSPQIVRDAAIPSQRAKADRLLASAIDWLTQYRSLP